MASTVEAIAANIRVATEPGFRRRLLARGQARSMMWREGGLPADTPPFSNLLSYDLLSYGYSLLSHGLRLLELEGDRSLARIAFEHAASAIEAVMTNGRPGAQRDFHTLVAAAAYHLGRYSARSFSLLHGSLQGANLSIPEQCLANLMLRDLNELERVVYRYKSEGVARDEALVNRLRADEGGEEVNGEAGEAPDLDPALDVLVMALDDSYLSALSTALLAFERGDHQLLDAALARLRVGLDGTKEFNLVPQWWCHRLTIYLLDELWECSFHAQLAPVSPDPAAVAWPQMRELFIASLFRRGRAEIDLWPSQLEAAKRALDVADNLVVSLPTSSGKTRIAELCILACLTAGRRVVFVTPLRALSAQTELNLQKTFQPLGKAVSSLYGAIGAGDFDDDILRSRDIIVSTPEKLDFALRSDPSLLDDVGLVILDEGHMIGLGEREVRYEVQIQRLLRRADAKQRRIVCLSAILPDGDKLEDFVAWLTNDQDNGLIQKDWRPTRLRFGQVDWHGNHATLRISVGDEKPFIPKFLLPRFQPKHIVLENAKPKVRRKAFPADQREFCLATAWRLVEEGQSVLIFCPLRRSVEPFAEAIVDLSARGLLTSVLDADPAALATALAIGAEWFGPNHFLLRCLELGVAVHHGALPTPYRREVERLLREDILKVTISSPTLAQGLNLAAGVLVFHGLDRNRQTIDISEFRNVVGRTGRAYVDIEGLVVYPVFDDRDKRLEAWNKLVADTGGKEMESGLLRLLLTLVQRIVQAQKIKSLQTFLDYLGGQAAWTFPVSDSEKPEKAALEHARWSDFLTSLDTAVLAMLGDQEVADDEIEAKLDIVLQSSLWSRRLGRKDEPMQKALKSVLVARTRHIWSQSTSLQRRGYFLAGIGLDTGLSLDAKASELGDLLVRANGAILSKDHEKSIALITEFAEQIFAIAPFAPDKLPSDWKSILAAWLKGEAIIEMASGREAEVLAFIEGVLAYRLPWGMEAVRVRGLVHDDPIGHRLTLSDVELGVAVGCVETGTLDRSAAFLIRAGFSSRLAAIKAVQDGNGNFTTISQLRAWIGSQSMRFLASDPSWPMPQANALWKAFVGGLQTSKRATWRAQTDEAPVDWNADQPPPAGAPVRVLCDARGVFQVFSPAHELLGTITSVLRPTRIGLLKAEVTQGGRLSLTYLGPEELA